MNMSKIRIVSIIVLAVLVTRPVAAQNKIADFQVLKGPYLGQKPPGITPEIFAPGIITTHYSQTYIAFLNSGRICVYSATGQKTMRVILI